MIKFIINNYKLFIYFYYFYKIKFRNYFVHTYMAGGNKRSIYPPQQIRDGGGNLVDFQISCGEQTSIDISAGYEPDAYIAEKGFYLCPLVSGDIVVQLIGQLDGDTFTIPSARIDVMLGMWMEEKVKRVIATETTVTSCLIGWSN